MRDGGDATAVHGHQRSAWTAQADELRDAIAREEAVLAGLQAQQAESRQQLTALRAPLAALDAEAEIRVHVPFTLDPASPWAPAARVRLFRSLFHGRCGRLSGTSSSKCQERPSPASGRRPSVVDIPK